MLMKGEICPGGLILCKTLNMLDLCLFDRRYGHQRRGSSTENMPLKWLAVGTPVGCFLNWWSRCEHPTIPGMMVLCSFRKQLEQTRRSKSVKDTPSCPLSQYLPLGTYLFQDLLLTYFNDDYVRVNKTNLPLQVALVVIFNHSNRKLS